MAKKPGDITKKKSTKREMWPRSVRRFIQSGKAIDTKQFMIVKMANEIIRSYAPMKISVRQLHYRILELQKKLPADVQAWFVYKNNMNEYNGLSRTTTAARYFSFEAQTAQETQFALPMDSFVDRSRDVFKADVPENIKTFEEQFEHYPLDPAGALKEHIDMLRYRADDFSIHYSFRQPAVCAILLEKKAEQDVFMQAINIKDDHGADVFRAHLIVTQGQGSTSQKSMAATIMRQEKREIHALEFGDLDPWGEMIYNTMIDDLRNEFKISFASVEHVALTDELVNKYNLPWTFDVALTNKLKPYPQWQHGPRDSAGNLIEQSVIELDALDPAVLNQLVNEAIDKHFDKRIYNEVRKLEQQEKEDRKKRIEKAVLNIEEGIRQIQEASKS